MLRSYNGKPNGPGKFTALIVTPDPPRRHWGTTKAAAVGSWTLSTLYRSTTMFEFTDAVKKGFLHYKNAVYLGFSDAIKRGFPTTTRGRGFFYQYARGFDVWKHMETIRSDVETQRDNTGVEP